MKNYLKGKSCIKTENFTFRYKNGDCNSHIIELICDNEVGKRKILKYIPFFGDYSIQYIGEELANNIIDSEVIISETYKD